MCVFYFFVENYLREFMKLYLGCIVDSTIVGIVMFIFAIYILVLIAYIYMSMQHVRRQAENQKLQEKVVRKYKYYKEIYKKQEAVAKIRHDLANHLSVLQGLAENRNSQEQYQKEITTYLERLIVLEPEMQPEKVTQIKKTLEKNWVKTSAKRFVKVALVIAVVLSLVCNSSIPYAIFVIIVTAIGVVTFSLYYLYLFMQLQNKKKEQEKLMTYLEFMDGSEEKWKEIQIEIQVQKYELEQNKGIGILKICDQMLGKPLTGDPILDAMIYNKIVLCKNYEIQQQIQITAIKETSMTHMDMIGLLGNLIDNAIEASAKVEGKRYIRVRTYMKAKFWFIVVQNSKLGMETPKEMKFHTTKINKDVHGYGVKIIYSIVNKYGGTIQLEDKGTEFLVTVMI